MKWPWSKQTEKSGQQGHMTLADVHDYIGSRYGVSPVKAFVCLVKSQFRECARISFGSVHETFAGLRTDPPTLTATS